MNKALSSSIIKLALMGLSNEPSDILENKHNLTLRRWWMRQVHLSQFLFTTHSHENPRKMEIRSILPLGIRALNAIVNLTMVFPSTTESLHKITTHCMSLLSGGLYPSVR